MAGYSLVAAGALAWKIYGFLKSVQGAFSDDGVDLATVIEEAKEEIIDKMEDLDHDEMMDQVSSYIHDFTDFAYYTPQPTNLQQYIQRGTLMIERLETRMLEKEALRPHVYKYDGKYAYYDAPAYNLVVLLRVAAMRMASFPPEPVCDLYRRALSVNFELVGEPTSQPLPYSYMECYTSPVGVRSYIAGRLWQHLFLNESESWQSGSLEVVCKPVYPRRQVSISNHPGCVRARSFSETLEGPAEEADRQHCLELFTSRFFADPVVTHVLDCNKQLIGLMGGCQIGLRDVANSLGAEWPVSAREDLYGPESTDRPIRAMCEVILSRSPDR